ncbi:Re/Si-specific NAD(P)(+) transhydrogenase subunit alpha [Tessaracoccus sp. OH4464_COT-324]|uniref:Re/Si-specific NAD(P)(+) transhydrogenase subunit alpha n=1 Tax=Tessaracoccus sp. OH4464_COT-324 TaxID=2491059 RepID=UPI000F631581|nr:Re/Si-specific NAD(P)(+) transhydrogenase subunit alpha [Tessaracoccus sp. OH4464_COT-324]RRD47479.1 Re/Si-specific NAD(P)(+) transhydrogenase subunit alpha [Tessaracoccus sp. OH4464_COT-324]
MEIGVPKEIGDARVAATPKSVAGLNKLGYEVTIESGAGLAASFADDAYEEAGARIVADPWLADIVLAVNAPSQEQLQRMRAGATLITFLAPRQNPELVERLAAQGITALSMDMVPRTSRAQALDALSSLANISGYRAVIEAAHAFGRFFTGQVTAAGKVPPAKVLVAGTGVAGLAAIGAANSLGAIVRATDVRPETAEQVESMGATFLHVAADQGVSSDGYAKEASADYAAKAAELYAQQAKEVDIIITTAAIPGRPSPKLITADMVATMRPGSVIVDLAAVGGGNCELTRPGEAYETGNGVTIIGYTDMVSRLPGQASQLYGTNLVNALQLMTPGKDGELVVDFDDEVVRNMTITRDGEVTFPPPPIQVSAAPASTVPAKVVEPVVESRPPRPWWQEVAVVGIGSILMIALLTVAPSSFVTLFGVFALACVVGYYVVWNVTHALHTPLMSVTNAISGIIVVGAMTQLASENLMVKIIAFVAVLIASINVFGGFTVTHRMLNMFRKG